MGQQLVALSLEDTTREVREISIGLCLALANLLAL